MSEGLTASGGWCAPSETLYDVGVDREVVYPQFPKVSVNRGGFKFDVDLTPEEAAARSAWNTYVRRVTEQMLAARSAAVDQACIIALANDWDVHVYEPPEPFTVWSTEASDLYRLRSVGVEFTPAEHPIPTIHYHRYNDDWMYED